MEEQFEKAIELIKEQENISACITGSCMLGYKDGWNQDIDIFCYSESSFRKLLFFMHYNPMFNILDKLEQHKYAEYVDNNQSSLDKLSLITIKFHYNTCIPINLIYKKHQKNIFDCISAFDLDLIAQGYCLKTKQLLTLRETTGMKGTWNKWNPYFYTKDFWSVKRLLRQFERVVKYTNRGYDLTEVTDKYISIIDDIINMENFYKSEKGTKYFTDSIGQFEVISKILHAYKKEGKMSEIELLTLKTLV